MQPLQWNPTNVLLRFLFFYFMLEARSLHECTLHFAKPTWTSWVKGNSSSGFFYLLPNQSQSSFNFICGVDFLASEKEIAKWVLPVRWLRVSIPSCRWYFWIGIANNLLLRAAGVEWLFTIATYRVRVRIRNSISRGKMRTSSCKGEVEIVESKGDTERCIIPAWLRRLR